MNSETENKSGPLKGLKVLDLSRILAGPTCTQLFGDMGAEIIKIERPQKGDDTRFWGPPFLKDTEGNDTTESAYYLSANRNKNSVAVDLTKPEGQAIIRDLAKECDVLIENFKAGDLARYGLDYDALIKINPGLIYCSITGFGMTGPYAQRPGYDFLIQGMGGVMSLTGKSDEEGGEPTKCGVGIADVMCGMYASTAILSALHARHASGKGQHIDISLLDCQVAWLINQGVGYLVSGEVPPRRGNEHPTIVPYGTFKASDQAFIIAAGNDAQFERLCSVIGAEELAKDERYATNKNRVINRRELIPMIDAKTETQPSAHWLQVLEEAGVPCGPVNDLAQTFADPQIQHREMAVTLAHREAGEAGVRLIGNPLNFSETPVKYDKAPPVRAEHTKEILAKHLGLSDEKIAELEENGIIECLKN
ncbi:MAG: CaiB/BaiF CoA-transferase family protein [Rhizobiaceae bacterium]|nr:CaiB/BaiF CoA-transferase family protein [Rhizobiaceae bacterium]